MSENLTVWGLVFGGVFKDEEGIFIGHEDLAQEGVYGGLALSKGNSGLARGEGRLLSFG